MEPASLRPVFDKQDVLLNFKDFENSTAQQVKRLHMRVMGKINRRLAFRALVFGLMLAAAAPEGATAAALERRALAAADPSLTTVAIGSGQRFGTTSAPAVLAAGERFDVMALGPGLGTGREGFVQALLEQWDRPLVLDADAIAAAGVEALAARCHPTVITPHAGEFLRLTGEDAGYRQAADLASRTGAVVLLKGNPTVIAGEETWLVASGGPELATLGSGDVLTGMIAALMARGLDAETAARSAAYRHGRAAADLAAVETVTAAGLARHVGRFAG